jgi:hypothetical protein
LFGPSTYTGVADARSIRASTHVVSAAALGTPGDTRVLKPPMTSPAGNATATFQAIMATPNLNPAPATIGATGLLLAFSTTSTAVRVSCQDQAPR